MARVRPGDKRVRAGDRAGAWLGLKLETGLGLDLETGLGLKLEETAGTKAGLGIELVPV